MVEHIIFAGRSVDDLIFSLYMNFNFFGMQPLPNFASYDVMKSSEIEKDFERFDTHVDKHFFRKRK